MIIQFILVTIVSATTQSCERYITDLLLIGEVKGYPQLIKSLMPYLPYSGNSLNSFGMYEACLRRGFFYSSVKIKMDPLPSYFGFCHTTECTTDDLNDQQLQDDVKQLINETQIIDKLLNKYNSSLITLKKYNISLDNIQLEFIDPQTMKQNHGPFLKFTLFILIISFILSLYLPSKKLLKLFTTQQYTNYFIPLKNQDNINNEEQEMLTQKTVDRDPIQQYQQEKSNILNDFSIQENYNNLFTFKEYDSNLSIMDGFRSLGFFMVIFGHQFLDLAKFSFVSEMLAQLNSWLCLDLINMFYSVDMFLWLGGFFFGYILFETNKIKKINNNPLSIIIILLHRILRIWPCYMIAILITTQIAPLLGDGPRWFTIIDRYNCQTGWRNILFIDNLFYDKEYCFPWGWYMSTDMQLFIISLLPLLIYAKFSQKLSKWIIISYLIISQSIGTIMTFQKEYLLPPFAMIKPQMYQDYYTKPFTRSPPYFLGLLIGLLFREYKENKINIFTYLQKYKEQKQKLFQLTCYTLGGGIILILWFGWRSAQINWKNMEYWNKTIQELWFAFCRIGFTFGMTIISLPCLLGIKDIFNYTFMSNYFFKFINKISFTGYLLHQVIIFSIIGQFYQTPNFQISTVITLYLGNVLITIFVSIIFSLLIELPFSKIQNRCMKYIYNK